jgi:ABC-type transport system substrate-binding protein
VELFGKDSALGYANPKVSALLDEAQFTVDQARFEQIFRELWPIFQAELPATFLYPSVWTTVANRRVHGLSSSGAHVHPGWCMFDLWLEDER